MIDMFHIDPAIIPKGQSYEWKRLQVQRGDFIDKQHLKSLSATGWKPVPKKRHKALETSSPMFIVRGGMVLCWRHAMQTKHAQYEEKRKAKALVDKIPEILASGVPMGAIASGFVTKGGETKTFGVRK